VRVVARLAPKTDQFETDAFTRQFVLDKIGHWRELLLQHEEGLTNCTLTREDIWRALDQWLDELTEIRGR
jgi:hypothetical protein